VRIISIINQKGGCGKTTTAINLAGILARRNVRTLLVDLDPQSHCAAGLAIPEQRIDVQIGDAMLARPDQAVDWTRLLWRVSRHLDLAPSTVRLAALESARGGLAAVENPEMRLAGVLSRLADQYDFCLIDCPPNIGMLTYNALAASTEIIVPVETAFFALQGAAKQITAIKSMAKRLGVSPIYRVLPTMHDPGSTLARDVLEELARRFGDHLIPVTIRFDQRLREAVTYGQPIVDYASEAAGSQDYQALADYLITGKSGMKMDSLTRTPAPTIAAGPLSPVTVRVSSSDGLLAGASGGLGNGLKKPESRDGLVPAGELVTPALTPAASVPVNLPPISSALPSIGSLASVRFDSAAPVATLAAQTLPATGPSTGTTFETKPSPVAPASVDEIRTRLLELTSRVSKLADRTRVNLGSLETPREPAPPAEGVPQSILGVKVTAAGVLFVQPVALGQKVYIAGDFNNWSPTASPLIRNDHLGVMERLIPMQAGSYQYRLVIDGQWTHDTFNTRSVPNPFGGLNSVLEVPAKVRASSEIEAAI
jgi:chromosome partitioning protein